jgi:hypothetical protein
MVVQTSWLGDQPIARPLSVYGSTNTGIKDVVPRVGFETTNTEFELLKLGETWRKENCS